jgi:hypothetical protein
MQVYFVASNFPGSEPLCLVVELPLNLFSLFHENLFKYMSKSMQSR